MNDLNLSDLTEFKREPRVAKLVRLTPDWITPDGISYARMALAMASGLAVFVGWYMAAFAVVVLAAISDWYDGALAHARGEETLMGAFLDPLADKVFVLTTMVALLPRLHAGFWALFLCLAVIEVRLVVLRLPHLGLAVPSPDAASKVKANNAGKLKLVAEMVALSLLIVGLHRGSPWLIAAGLFCTILSLLFASISLASRNAKRP